MRIENSISEYSGRREQNHLFSAALHLLLLSSSPVASRAAPRGWVLPTGRSSADEDKAKVAAEIGKNVDEGAGLLWPLSCCRYLPQQRQRTWRGDDAGVVRCGRPFIRWENASGLPISVRKIIGCLETILFFGSIRPNQL